MSDTSISKADLPFYAESVGKFIYFDYIRKMVTNSLDVLIIQHANGHNPMINKRDLRIFAQDVRREN